MEAAVVIVVAGECLWLYSGEHLTFWFDKAPVHCW
jgi:hypothetical protein